MEQLNRELFDDRSLVADRQSVAGIPACKTICYTGPAPAPTGCITNFGCRPTDQGYDFGF
ncbi:MAG: hypothetical protein QNK37_38135 [Acidobacteriota bacterium]|nr:hypothetical protein [Acidobacteriota bacterium]